MNKIQRTFELSADTNKSIENYAKQKNMTITDAVEKLLITGLEAKELGNGLEIGRREKIKEWILNLKYKICK